MAEVEFESIGRRIDEATQVARDAGVIKFVSVLEVITFKKRRNSEAN
jgi:hypothetical protein